MDDQLRRFQHLQSQVEELKRKKSEAEGTLRYLESQLKEEFGCDDLSSAKKKLLQLEKQVQKAQQTYDNTLEEFEQKWGSVLEHEKDR